MFFPGRELCEKIPHNHMSGGMREQRGTNSN
jgi:hypothetical protein